MVGIVVATLDAARVNGISAVPLDFTRMSKYLAVNKDAFPSNPALAAGCAESFGLPKQAQMFTSPDAHKLVLSREVSSAISGFRSLCGHQRRSFQKAIALNWTCVLEPFNRSGLSL